MSKEELLKALAPLEDGIDEILDPLYCDAWYAGRVAERTQSGIRSVTPSYAVEKVALKQLIAEEARKGRVDELKKWVGCCDKCVLDRIAELTNTPSGKEDK